MARPGGEDKQKPLSGLNAPIIGIGVSFSVALSAPGDAARHELDVGTDSLGTPFYDDHVHARVGLVPVFKNVVAKKEGEGPRVREEKQECRETNENIGRRDA